MQTVQIDHARPLSTHFSATSKAAASYLDENARLRRTTEDSKAMLCFQMPLLHVICVAVMQLSCYAMLFFVISATAGHLHCVLRLQRPALTKMSGPYLHQKRHGTTHTTMLPLLVDKSRPVLTDLGALNRQLLLRSCANCSKYLLPTFSFDPKVHTTPCHFKLFGADFALHTWAKLNSHLH